MIATSCVATTKLVASSLSGLLFLVTGAGGISIVRCCAGAGTTTDLNATAHMNDDDQSHSNRVEPAKKSFACFSHPFFPRGSGESQCELCGHLPLQKRTQHIRSQERAQSALGKRKLRTPKK